MVYKSLGFDQMETVHVIVMGVDVIVTWLVRFIHILELIKEKYTNDVTNTRLTNLKVLSMNEKTVSWHLKEFFLSPSFPDVDFHALQSHCKLTKEVPREHFFRYNEKLCVIDEAEVKKAP